MGDPRGLAAPGVPRRFVFAAEYLRDHNGTQAAIRAGYAPKRAGNTAWMLRKRPDVQAELVRLSKRAVAAATLPAEAPETASAVATAAALLNRAWQIAQTDARDRVPALVAAQKHFPELREAAVDQSQHLHLPPGTTIDDLRALLAEARALKARELAVSPPEDVIEIG